MPHWRATANRSCQTLEGFARERSDYYRRVESEVVQLALAIARKILHREAQLDPHLLAGLVRVTLEKLDAATKVELHVPPHETTDWRHYFACQVEGVPVPEVHEDRRAGPRRMPHRDFSWLDRSWPRIAAQGNRNRVARLARRATGDFR